MTTVGAYEAKTHLPRLLDQVDQGETVTITKHGRAVAKLVAVDGPRTDARRVVAALKTARASVPAVEGSIRDLIEQGRR